ncbi:MAG: ATP-binding cassette domain-containing protein [Algicola sp.]|nr:ATP-binding cassette domain-containing protein [Algicola sp.]
MITVSNLAKRFKMAKSHKLSDAEKSDTRLHDGYFHSVTDVSFECEAGQVLGLLGPNGAGKTTTLRMLSSALKPDSGLIAINGVDVVKKPLLARKKIGFLSGSTGLYGRLTARENVEYFGKLHGMNPAQLSSRIDELFELLGIHEFATRRAENLSTGMKQKTSIARAVVHNPEIVVLDEPTTGLDIMATQTVMDFIIRLKAQGTPVIFSTHHLDEVSLLCDKVVIIDEGRSCFAGSVEELLQHTNAQNLNQAFISVITQKPSAAPLVTPIANQNEEA